MITIWRRFAKKKSGLSENESDAGVFYQILSRNGVNPEEWTNRKDCECSQNERRYLIGTELERYVDKYGWQYICVGRRGGVYVPVKHWGKKSDEQYMPKEKYEERESLDIQGVTDFKYTKLTFKDNDKLEGNLTIWGDSEENGIIVTKEALSLVDEFVENPDSLNKIFFGGRLRDFAEVEKEWVEISKQGKVDLASTLYNTSISPRAESWLKIAGVLNELKIGGIVELLGLPEDLFELVMDYYDIKNRNGSVSPCGYLNIYLQNKDIFHNYGIYLSLDKIEEECSNLITDDGFLDCDYYNARSKCGEKIKEQADKIESFFNEKHLPARMMVAGAVGTREWRGLYKKFHSLKDPKERKELIYNFVKNMRLIPSLYSFAELVLEHYNFLARSKDKEGKQALKYLYTIFCSGLKEGERSRCIKNFKKLPDSVNKIVRRAIFLSGYFTNVVGLHSQVSSRLAVGISLFGARMNGSYGINSVYLERLLEYLYGDGRPKRIIGGQESGIHYLFSFINLLLFGPKTGNRYATGRSIMDTYLMFVQEAARHEFGDKIELYRSLNKGESLVLGFVPAMKNLIDHIEDKKIKKILGQLIMKSGLITQKDGKPKLVYRGYTSSTSFVKEANKKFLEHRFWTSGIWVNFHNVSTKNVIALPFSATAGFVDDTEVTIMVPKEGLEFDPQSFFTVEELKDKNEQRYLRALVLGTLFWLNDNGEKISGGDVVKRFLEYHPDYTPEKLVEDYVTEATVWFIQSLIDYAGGANREDPEYRRMLNATLLSFPVVLKNFELVLKDANINIENYWDLVNNTLLSSSSEKARLTLADRILAAFGEVGTTGFGGRDISRTRHLNIYDIAEQYTKFFNLKVGGRTLKEILGVDLDRFLKKLKEAE